MVLGLGSVRMDSHSWLKQYLHSWQALLSPAAGVKAGTAERHSRLVTCLLSLSLPLGLPYLAFAPELAADLRTCCDSKGWGQFWLNATGELQDQPGSSPRQHPPWRWSCREMGKAGGSWDRRKGEIKPCHPYKGRTAVTPARWHIIQALSCDSGGTEFSHLPSVLS